MTAGPSSPPNRRRPRRTLHIFALAALAVAQPVFDVVVRSPEFLVAHDLDGLDLVAVSAVVLLGIPGALTLLAWMAGRADARVRLWFERIALSGLVALLALMAAKQLASGAGGAAMVGAGLLGAMATIAYERIDVARSFVSWLALGLIAIPAIFLTRPPIARLLRPPAPVERRAVVPGRTPQLVVVVFDQLPLVSLLGADGRIDEHRYPSFAALGREAVWFRQATTVGNYTGWALPALLTGTYPDRQRLPSATDHPDNLFTLLGGAYDLEVREPLTALCPPSLCARPGEPRLRRIGGALQDLGIVYLHVALPDSLSESLPPVDEGWRDFAPAPDLQTRWSERRDDDRRREPLAFIESLGPRNRPTLHFLHALLPHEPYVYLPTGQVVTSRVLPGLRGDRWTNSELTVAQNQRMQLLQVGYVDRLLGLLIARMKQQGIYEDAALVVTSDHGASFRPGSNFKGFARDNIVDLMSVPLFIKRSGQSVGVIDDGSVETIDLLPTIADMLDLGIPWTVDGRSALDPDVRARNVKRLSTGNGTYREIAHPLDLSEPVRLKIARFGSAEDAYAPPASAPFRGLVGTAPADHVVLEQGDIRSTVTAPHLFTDLPAESPYVPARLSGRVNKAGANVAAALAIAVNGLIRTTTRVLDAPGSGARGRWTALVDPAAFHPGDNTVEVFGVSSDGAGVTLTPLYASAPAAGDTLHLALEATELAYGIRLTGFHPEERIGDRPVRCTDGDGRLVVPAYWTEPPTALVVSIARASIGVTRLELRVDDCRLLEERIPAGGWSRTIPLESCAPAADPTTIEIISDSFQTRDGRRTIGVCLDALRFVTAR